MKKPSLTHPLPTALRCACASGVLVLAACGGGGGDTSTSASSVDATSVAPSALTSSSAPAAALASADAAGAAAGVGSTCNIKDFEAKALERMNQLRAAGADCGARSFAAAPALGWNSSLTQAAEGHAQDMAKNNFFSHTGSSGSTLASRVDGSGYPWTRLGENIAAGYAGIDSVMEGWMKSAEHCANLMNPSLREVGLVRVPGTPTSDYETYWVMDLGLSL